MQEHLKFISSLKKDFYLDSVPSFYQTEFSIFQNLQNQLNQSIRKPKQDYHD